LAPAFLIALCCLSVIFSLKRGNTSVKRVLLKIDDSLILKAFWKEFKTIKKRGLQS